MQLDYEISNSSDQMDGYYIPTDTYNYAQL